MAEIIIEEEDYKTTFEIEKNIVVFRDYDLGGDKAVSVFSMSSVAFELAVKAWNESKR